MSQVIAFSAAKKAGEFSREFLKKELGYDFFGLMVKLIVYFFSAWFLEGYLRLASGIGDPNSVLARIFGSIGGIPLISLPQWVKSLVEGTKFIKPEIKPPFSGITYWVMVKGVAMFLILLEAKNYYDLNEVDNRKPSPITLSIFVILFTLLGAMTFPDVIEKLKTGNLLAGMGK